MLNSLEESLKQRAADINAVLQPFNLKMQKELCVSYRQCGTTILPDFEWLIYGRSVSERALYKRMNIRETDIVQYMLQLCGKMGPIEFFRMVLQNDVAMAQNLISIKRYFTKISVKLIDAGIESITPEQETELIGEIFSAIVTERNMSLVQSYFKQFLKQNDRFDLLFNVNNREGSNGQARFMNVRDLSLGQKVVAMLTFVLGYSEHSNDYRPLIIDQPEDPFLCDVPGCAGWLFACSSLRFGLYPQQGVLLRIQCLQPRIVVGLPRIHQKKPGHHRPGFLHNRCRVQAPGAFDLPDL